MIDLTNLLPFNTSKVIKPSKGRLKRKEVTVYRYYSNNSEVALYTTIESEVVNNRMGYNQKFRNCKEDKPNMIYGRVDGVRMFVCHTNRLNCLTFEKNQLQSSWQGS